MSHRVFWIVALLSEGCCKVELTPVLVDFFKKGGYGGYSSCCVVRRRTCCSQGFLPYDRIGVICVLRAVWPYEGLLLLLATMT